MRIIKTPREMQRYADSLRCAGKTIAFVPTMGYFHEGHLELMRVGRKMADELVVSIFVNPTQFGPQEDLAAYPRNMERDLKMAASVGVDTVYNPELETMYTQGYETRVRVENTSAPLCGVSRPVHFGGVATVCTKLFIAVRPHWAVFGEKDYQQCLVVTRLVQDLDLDMEIVQVPTYRESDGLAMSSRNVYMKPEERKQAPVLIRALREVEKQVENGERNAEAILAKVHEIIGQADLARVDYAELRSLPGLAEVKEKIEGPTLLALAVFFGKARLIDNVVLLRHDGAV